jgi:solute carrier family 50 protein (sugar transporter)
MGTVVRTKSVEYMPLSLSVCTLLCALSWSVYAIYVGDATILVPNILGVLLAIVQLGLYATYCGSGSNGGEAAALHDAEDGGAAAEEREGAGLLDGDAAAARAYEPPVALPA